MVESVAARRTANHPLLTDVTITPPSATELNPINGHEHETTTLDELQYACIFPIDPVPCNDENAAECECNAEEAEHMRPLCAYPSGTDNGGEQRFSQAYPSLRQLRVLERLDDPIVTSACPKVVDPESRAHGYRPAADALVDRLAPSLAELCLPRSLPLDAEDVPACRLLEASRDEPCDCLASGRTSPPSGSVAHMRQTLRDSSFCGSSGQTECEDFCVCEIPHLQGDDLEACRHSSDVGSALGYCYIDSVRDPPVGDPDLVASCAGGHHRRLRFTGEDLTRTDTVLALTCAGPENVP
jgi:hypothetical protein